MIASFMPSRPRIILPNQYASNYIECLKIIRELSVLIVRQPPPHQRTIRTYQDTTLFSELLPQKKLPVARKEPFRSAKNTFNLRPSLIKRVIGPE
jgi:hypothetical protein